MIVSNPTRPSPVADDQSEGFWAACATSSLAMQQCGGCGWFAYPPNLLCINCRLDPPQFEWTTVSGEGRLKSWTIIRDSFLPGFTEEIPYVVADIELDQQPGLRMIARLEGVAESELERGMPLHVVFGELIGQTRIPHFVRAAT